MSLVRALQELDVAARGLVREEARLPILIGGEDQKSQYSIYSGIVSTLKVSGKSEKKDGVEREPFKVIIRKNVKKGQDPIKAMEYSQQLLAENNINSPFLNIILCCDHWGNKFLELAQHKDLIGYVRGKPDILMAQSTAEEMKSEKRTILDYQFSEKEFRLLAAQMILVVSYLHDHNIVHLDIKADNIFILNVGDDDFRAALGDLDSADKTNKEGLLVRQGRLHDVTILPARLARRAQKNKYYLDEANCKAIDWFALGHTLLQVKTYVDKEHSKIKETEYSSFGGEHVLSLIDLLKNYSNPPTAAQLKSHPFFGDHPEKLFAEVQKKGEAQQSYFFGKFAYTYPLMGSGFYLLPPEVQDCYFLIGSLHEQLLILSQFLVECIQSNFKFIKPCQQLCQSIQTKITKLSDQIDTLPKYEDINAEALKYILKPYQYDLSNEHKRVEKLQRALPISEEKVLNAQGFIPVDGRAAAVLFEMVAQDKNLTKCMWVLSLCNAAREMIGIQHAKAESSRSACSAKYFSQDARLLSERLVHLSEMKQECSKIDANPNAVPRLLAIVSELIGEPVDAEMMSILKKHLQLIQVEFTSLEQLQKMMSESVTAIKLQL